MTDSSPQPDTSDPHDPVEQLLEHAFESADQPPSVLDQLCAAAGIRARVDLQTPDSCRKADDHTGDSNPDLDTPRYRVYGEIAAGGMGRILRGRDVDLGRDVALKVLHKSSATSPGVLRRFVEEGQIGGQLQHPGIVPVYELGLSPNNEPFIAMKLVKGRTLSDLLKDREGPDQGLHRFLSVFEQVCQTMAYAHARGIIHRDLKPSNVMVGKFGEVQVMDWGLAKVLGAEQAVDQEPHRDGEVVTVRSKGDTSKSSVGSVIGTPAYMSPEQARGQIQDLDQRTDVFALGALLCEILTGLPPYVATTSTKVKRLAANACLEDARTRLRLCGVQDDLIEITNSCLDKDQRNRPSDAGAIATRISEYISIAQERARKAELSAVQAAARAKGELRARRLTTALAVAVIALCGTYIWFERDRQASTRRTDAATNNDLGDKLRQYKQYDAAIEAFQSAIEIDPEFEEAYSNIGVALREKGDWDGAIDWFQRALDINPRSAVTYFSWGKALQERGDPNGAIEKYTQALRHAEIIGRIIDIGLRLRELGEPDVAVRAFQQAIDSDPNNPEVYVNIGYRLRDKGYRDEAIEWFRHSLAIDPDFAAAYHHWGITLENRGDRDGAIKEYSRALERARTSERCNNLGVRLRDLGEFELATEAFQRAIELDASHVRPYRNIGTVFWKQGDLDSAIEWYGRAIEVNPKYALAHKDTADALAQKGDHTNASAWYQLTVELDPNNADAHFHLGLSYFEIGRYKDALEAGRRGHELGSGLQSWGHPDSAVWIRRLERLVSQENDEQTALELEEELEAARLVLRRSVDSEHLYADLVPEFWYTLGYSLHVQGKIEEALIAHEKAAIGESRFKDTACYNAACAHALLGNIDAAFDWLSKAADAGFDRVEVLKQDSDLDILREDSRYDDLIKRIQEGR